MLIAVCSASCSPSGSRTRRTSCRYSITCCRSTTCSASTSQGRSITSRTTSSRGNAVVTAVSIPAPGQAGPRAPVRPAADLLHEARARERAACIPEAIKCYEATIAAADRTDERAVLAEALRRLAVVRHHRNESAEARELCRRSYSVACDAGNDVLAAEALNTLGGLDLKTGAIEDARKNFLQALERGGESRELRARAEQNLGILANIQGDLGGAVAHYERSLEAYRASNDEHGCAIAYANLGIANTDLRQYDKADDYFRRCYVSAGSVLGQAEASRELALLLQTMGRNQDALTLLNAAHRLFGRLDARVDLVYVGGRVSELETTYFAVVLEWGQSIESTDSYTFGHCERVAQHAMAVARVLRLDETSQTTIRLGAYLHDLGKVRVPHEILNKPGPLTRAEFEVVQMHPIWGIELLAAVEFPWDLKPIIRHHHERYDGTGYPDRLRGDAIPLSAQVVGIVDVFDALTTTRPYRQAFSRRAAVATIEGSRGLWSDAVLRAFFASLAQPPAPAAEALAKDAPLPVPRVLARRWPSGSCVTAP